MCMYVYVGKKVVSGGMLRISKTKGNKKKENIIIYETNEYAMQFLEK